MTSSQAIDLILGLGVLTALAFTLIHERREIARDAAREKRELDRHDFLVREVQDFKRIAFGERAGRADVDERLDDHGIRLDDHHRRIAALEEASKDDDQK